MKSIIVSPVHNLKMVEKEKPVATEGRVIIKSKYNAICGSDNMLWNTAEGMALGHEFSGYIEDPGDFPFEKGQKVCAAEFNSCRVCEHCKAGNEQLCKFMMVDNPGVTADGALGEYFSVRGDYVIPIPDDMDMSLGAIVEPVSVALHGVKFTTFKEGDPILVWGNGPIGIYAALCAKLLGAGKVYMVGRGMGRVNFCNTFDFIDECFSTKDEEFDSKLAAVKPEDGFPAIIDALGLPNYDPLFDLAKSGATIVMLGMHGVKAEFTPMTMYFKELALHTGLYFSWEDYQQAFKMIYENQELFGSTITSHIPADAEAIQNMYIKLYESGANDECKVLVEWDD